MKLLRIFNDRDPAEKRWVTLAYILLTMTMLCGIASVLFYVTNESSQSEERDAERIEDRDDARYTACVNFNIEQQGDRDSTLNIALVALGFTNSGDLSAVDREVIVLNLEPDIQERYAEVAAQTAIDNPFRDCSPAAIDSYYEDPVPDPGAVPNTTEA
jgi:hypothetical protein